MNEQILNDNRVMLCHFDSYSTALVFARFGLSVLAPSVLPEGAAPAAAPADRDDWHQPSAVLAAVSAQYAFDTAEWETVDGFDEWVSAESQLIRIHLARATTFEAPRAAIAPFGGVFKPISELRGTAPAELNLVRRAFNLIMGGR